MSQLSNSRRKSMISPQASPTKKTSPNQNLLTRRASTGNMPSRPILYVLKENVFDGDISIPPRLRLGVVSTFTVCKCGKRLFTLGVVILVLLFVFNGNLLYGGFKILSLFFNTAYWKN